MFDVPSPQETTGEEAYDPRKRDPQYAHASASPLYELVSSKSHAHTLFRLILTLSSFLCCTTTIQRYHCMPASYSSLNRSLQPPTFP